MKIVTSSLVFGYLLSMSFQGQVLGADIAVPAPPKNLRLVNGGGGEVSGTVGVKLVGLEVTQAIQKIDPTDPWNDRAQASNTVILIANRKTYVRAYFDLQGSSPGTVDISGNVSGSLNGTSLGMQSALASITVSSAENDQLVAKRADLSKSLNFELPDSWVAKPGTLKLSVDVIGVNGTVTCTDSQGQTCSNRSVPFGLHSPKPLRVRLVRIVEEDDSGNPLRSPTDTDIGLTKSWLKRAYPIQNLDSTSDIYLEDGQQHWSSVRACEEANNAVASYRILDINKNMDPRTRLVGLFSNGTREFGGCAAGSLAPDTDDPQLLVSVPTGAIIPNSWPNSGNWDNDGSYADWYTGHELSHTFGRRHLQWCGAPPAEAPPAFDLDPFVPPYGGEISDAEGSYVGFDVGHLGTTIPGANMASLAMKPLPGSAWHEIRTYCDRLWVSSYVYEWVRQALELENPPPPTVLKIEKDDISEEILARVFKCMGETPTDPTLLALCLRSRAHAFAFDSPKILKKAVAVCMEKVSGGPKAFILCARAQPDIIGGPKPSPINVEQGDFLVVVAMVNLTKQTAEFRSTARVKRAEVLPPADKFQATLKLLGDEDQVLSERTVFIRLNMRVKDHDETGLIYDAIKIPQLPEGKTIKSVKLFLAGKEEPVAVRTISKSPPEIVSLRASLQDAGNLAGPIAVEWQADDPDTGREALTYTVEISLDAGKTWHTIAAGRPHIGAAALPKQQMTISSREIEAQARKYSDKSPEVLIKMVASDGFNNSAEKIERVIVGARTN